ncbi:MAG: hypothetical protein WBI63_00605, partial [Coriobacteriia bacterium]
MTACNELIDAMIGLTKAKCKSWVEIDDDGFSAVVDPNEHRVIASHYANSHLCAALLLNSDTLSQDFRLGIDLLEGLLSRWEIDCKEYDFHHDFNSFALCIVAGRLEDCIGFEETVEKLKSLVLSTPDSRHFTVNWLPMRIFVNLRRFDWSQDGKYLRRVRILDRLLGMARHRDGLIEDRLPKGKSFCLQYDVATTAGLELLNHSGCTYPVEDMLLPLVNACDPEGDINYFGRGCNQLFAWGPWLYLLRAQGQLGLLRKSVLYVSSRLPQMIGNDNLLLNSFRGKDKDFWWDYHYCSVYLSHFLLWLELTRALPSPCEESDLQPSRDFHGDTGLQVVRSDAAFAAAFDGRKQYLAERGPVVMNIWTSRHGTVMKGTFGPWLSPFGTLNGSACVLLNYFGLLDLVGNDRCA